MERKRVDVGMLTCDGSGGVGSKSEVGELGSASWLRMNLTWSDFRGLGLDQ